MAQAEIDPQPSAMEDIQTRRRRETLGMTAPGWTADEASNI